MTIDQWLNRVSGWEVIIPKGTNIAQYHGEARTLEQDTRILITLDPGEIRALARKALRNKSGRSRDGALVAKVQKGS